LVYSRITVLSDALIAVLSAIASGSDVQVIGKVAQPEHAPGQLVATGVLATEFLKFVWCPLNEDPRTHLLTS
jgi:hypothetical protein